MDVTSGKLHWAGRWSASYLHTDCSQQTGSSSIEAAAPPKLAEVACAAARASPLLLQALHNSTRPLDGATLITSRVLSGAFRLFAPLHGDETAEVIWRSPYFPGRELSSYHYKFTDR